MVLKQVIFKWECRNCGAILVEPLTSEVEDLENIFGRLGFKRPIKCKCRSKNDFKIIDIIMNTVTIDKVLDELKGE